MKRKLLYFFTFLSINFISFAQTDYSNVQFKSYIYEYKESEPRTTELGVQKDLLRDIVALLSNDIYSKSQQQEIIEKAWLAITKPKTFDYVYKDFAVTSNNTGEQKKAKVKLV